MATTDPDSIHAPRPTLVMLAVLYLAVILAAILGLAVFNQLDRRTMTLLLPLVTMVVTGTPALLAAGYSVRASNDLRNGKVVEKSRQGARLAIEESAPIVKDAVLQGIDEAQVLTRTGPVVTAEVQALAELLTEVRAQRQSTEQVAENTARLVGRRAGDRPTL